MFRKEIEESAVQIRQAYEAGVPVLCGTESGFSITPYGDWHYRELEVFVRDMNFTPLEAITAATTPSIRSVLFALLGLMFPAASVSTTALFTHHDSTGLP